MASPTCFTPDDLAVTLCLPHISAPHTSWASFTTPQTSIRGAEQKPWESQALPIW
eukprot:CAMPEP_0180417738 /NCGR_PEP_ID=MMETSP1036_2-20121128/1189_1 /TAXON_ID=632150 /ORGANISM="Azadinium spinosum, Strain 3D9" /LENGTH=54 /DNA_ID=CAMNT_0022422779 /DNA_START=121 /DNA_END=282 /DNA_ORIENTATION=-